MSSIPTWLLAVLLLNSFLLACMTLKYGGWFRRFRDWYESR
jgi:hypothetical protein